MTPAWITVAVLLGLVHAGHCAAMCGPFVLRAAAGSQLGLGLTAYIAGKTFTYAFLGAVAGAAGAGALALGDDAGRWLGWAVGSALVVAGLRRVLLPPAPGWLDRALGRFVLTLGAPARELTARHTVGGRFALGAVTGALPCGVVYLACLQALALGDGGRGAAFMVCFGLGTVPALLAVLGAGHVVRGRLSDQALRHLGGGLVLAAGLLTLWRAGIPGVVSSCPACFS